MQQTLKDLGLRRECWGGRRRGVRLVQQFCGTVVFLNLALAADLLLAASCPIPPSTVGVQSTGLENISFQLHPLPVDSFWLIRSLCFRMPNI